MICVCICFCIHHAYVFAFTAKPGSSVGISWAVVLFLCLCFSLRGHCSHCFCWAFAMFIFKSCLCFGTDISISGTDPLCVSPPPAQSKCFPLHRCFTLLNTILQSSESAVTSFILSVVFKLWNASCRLLCARSQENRSVLYLTVCLFIALSNEEKLQNGRMCTVNCKMLI